MSHPEQKQSDNGRPTVSLKVWLLWLGLSVLALIAHVANYMGNRGLAEVLAVVVMLSMAVILVTYLLRKTSREVREKGGSPLGSSKEIAVWNVLWTIPVLLFVFGFFGDLLTFKEEGKAMGVIAVISLIAIIPTYIFLGITRAIRKRRIKQS